MEHELDDLDAEPGRHVVGGALDLSQDLPSLSGPINKKRACAHPRSASTACT
jgi:hypothetical protein